MSTQVKPKKFDIEWISLMIEAKQMGLSREDVRLFIHKKTAKLSG